MTSRALVAAVACLLVGSILHATDDPAESEEQKILHAIGLALSRSLKNYNLSADDVAVVQRGLADGILKNDSQAALQTYGSKIEDYLANRRSAVTQQEKEAGKAFLDKLAGETGAVRLDSGMVYVEQQAGQGAIPSPTDSVKVHYVGTLRDGSMFDSSRAAGEPATFALAGVVPCFAEGIGRMHVGGKAKLVCPPELAYGDRGQGPQIPPGATLVFEVELLDIVGGAPAAPPNP